MNNKYLNKFGYWVTEIDYARKYVSEVFARNVVHKYPGAKVKALTREDKGLL
jgi:hypothetical protein